MSTVETKNVVCTFDLGRTLSCPITAVCLKARFDAGIFPALVSYTRETGTSAQIFGTGRVVIVGCKTNDHGLRAAYLLVEALWRLMRMDTSVLNFHVRNCVCRVSVGFKVNLDLFYEDVSTLKDVVLFDANMKGGPSFDKERFPGMAFAIRDERTGEKITVAMFDTGNGVGTGIKHAHQMDTLRAFLDLHMHRYKLGAEYRQQDPARVRSRTLPLSAKRARKREAESARKRARPADD